MYLGKSETSIRDNISLLSMDLDDEISYLLNPPNQLETHNRVINMWWRAEDLIAEKYDDEHSITR